VTAREESSVPYALRENMHMNFIGRVREGTVGEGGERRGL
jgi:hypothetical protein